MVKKFRIISITFLLVDKRFSENFSQFSGRDSLEVFFVFFVGNVNDKSRRSYRHRIAVVLYREFPIAQQFMAEECAGETGIVSDREYRSIAFFFHIDDAVATIHAHVARFDVYIHFRTLRSPAYYIIA